MKLTKVYHHDPRPSRTGWTTGPGAKPVRSPILSAAPYRSTIMRSDLDDLIARVEGLTEPSREVDADIARAFGLNAWAGRLSALNPDGSWTDIGTSLLTASIDAVLALAERVLPGYDWILEHTNGGLTISCRFGTANPDARVFGPTPALALLLAVLRAARDRG